MRTRILLLLAIAALLVGLAPAAPAAAAKPGTPTFTITATTTLTLNGESVTLTGPVSVQLRQFKVQGGQIVASGVVSGTLTGTSSAGTVTATFTNVAVVGMVSNIQANCPAGILTFDYRVVLPSSQVTVTENGMPVSLTGDVVFSGTVTITATNQPARSLICEIAILQASGASTQAIVDKLNVLLRFA